MGRAGHCGHGGHNRGRRQSYEARKAVRLTLRLEKAQTGAGFEATLLLSNKSVWMNATGETAIGALRELRGKAIKRVCVGNGTFHQDSWRIAALETIAAAVGKEREAIHG